jgi:hypothetical protein
VSDRVAAEKAAARKAAAEKAAADKAAAALAAAEQAAVAKAAKEKAAAEIAARRAAAASARRARFDALQMQLSAAVATASKKLSPSSDATQWLPALAAATLLRVLHARALLLFLLLVACPVLLLAAARAASLRVPAVAPVGGADGADDMDEDDDGDGGLARHTGSPTPVTRAPARMRSPRSPAATLASPRRAPHLGSGASGSGDPFSPHRVWLRRDGAVERDPELVELHIFSP